MQFQNNDGDDDSELTMYDLFNIRCKFVDIRVSPENVQPEEKKEDDNAYKTIPVLTKTAWPEVVEPDRVAKLIEYFTKQKNLSSETLTTPKKGRSANWPEEVVVPERIALLMQYFGNCSSAYNSMRL